MIDPREFRNSCGAFATGVTIIAAQDGEETRGMTANGFMSVSLDPALVVVSIGNNQKMCETIKNAGAYSVSILGLSQENISNHFAGKPDPEAEIVFDNKDGIPVLANCITCFTAEVKSAHIEGDHTLFVGQVKHFETKSDETPLLFHAGKYKALK